MSNMVALCSYSRFPLLFRVGASLHEHLERVRSLCISAISCLDGSAVHLCSCRFHAQFTTPLRIATVNRWWSYRFFAECDSDIHRPLFNIE
jgi:hypothetical protein